MGCVNILSWDLFVDINFSLSPCSPAFPSTFSPHTGSIAWLSSAFWYVSEKLSLLFFPLLFNAFFCLLPLFSLVIPSISFLPPKLPLLSSLST